MGAQKCGELQAEYSKIGSKLEATANAHSRLQTELQRTTEVYAAERKRVDVAEEMAASLQAAHEALFTKLSNTLEELEGHKGENQRVKKELTELRSSLAEECKLRKQLEEAEPPGPTQLCVNDILISVAFDGVNLPLEIRSWETNFEEVAQRWITAAQKSTQLQQSVVAYLRHLEESATAFPVKVDASLVDVHEKF